MRKEVVGRDLPCAGNISGKLCADICQSCGDECTRHDMAHCQQCAKACHHVLTLRGGLVWFLYPKCWMANACDAYPCNDYFAG